MVRRALLAGAVILASGGLCGAQILPTYPTTSSPSSVAWFPDRYPPSVFSNAGSLFGRTNALQLGINAADSQTARPAAFSSAFYNTQGRKILAGGVAASASWIGSLYIPSTWGAPSGTDGSGSRRSDLWATLWPATGGDTCTAAACDVFPIIGFSNAQSPDHDNDPGGTPRYRVFDGNNGGYVNLVATVAYDAWTDFCVTFTGSTVEYRIGGVLVYTASDLTQGDTSFGPVTQVNDVMVQAYNYGYTYDANWSHLAAGSGTCADLEALFEPPTPTPSATPTDTSTPTDTPTATPADTATATPTSTATATPAPPLITGGIDVGSNRVTGTGSPRSMPNACIEICLAAVFRMPNVPPCTAPDQILGTGGTDASGAFVSGGQPGIPLARPLADRQCVYAFDACAGLVGAPACAVDPAAAPALAPLMLLIGMGVLVATGGVGIARRRSARRMH